jgi:hypothetical protein
VQALKRFGAVKRALTCLALTGISGSASAQDIAGNPAGSGVIVSAVNWLQGTLLGTVATVVAVIAVAAVGLMMLTGRINLISPQSNKLPTQPSGRVVYPQRGHGDKPAPQRTRSCAPAPSQFPRDRTGSTPQPNLERPIESHAR